MKRMGKMAAMATALSVATTANCGAPADALDTDLSILVCLGKVERALFCGEGDALRERNAILRVIGELERCHLDYGKGRLFGAPDWAIRGLLNDDESLRSLNLAYARLLKLAGLLYGFGDYAARGRSLEESMLADPGEPPPFRDEAALPEAVLAYYRLMDDCRREMRAEIRPGGAGGSPFWNARARLFAYPPSFPFREIPGAASYRFEVLDDAHRLRTFGAVAPTASLAPVWPALPAGFVEVRCRALDASGCDIGSAGERRFWRSAPFDPAEYPASAGGYREARRKVLRHLLSWPQLAALETNGIPDIAAGDNFASYPSKMQSAVMMAMLAVAAELPEERERAMRIARASAAYLLSTAEAPGTPLSGFTATYTGTGQLAGTYAGQHMLVYPAMAGEAFLSFHRATGEAQWLDAATAIGRTYLRLQGDDGTWPLKMNAADGTSVGRNRLAPTTVVPFLDDLASATGGSAFRAAADRAILFIERGPMSDWDWEGQFEDIRPAEQRYQNLTKDMPCETAQVLLCRHPGDKVRIAQAREMLRFAEDQFAVWRAPCRQDGTGAWNPIYPFFAWRTPAVLEQYECYSPIDASSAMLIRTFLALYKAEGRALDLAKARALGDSMVRNQDASGRIRTYWIPEPGDGSDLAGAIRLPLGGDWFNCMFADAEVLGELAKATEEKP